MKKTVIIHDSLAEALRFLGDNFHDVSEILSEAVELRLKAKKKRATIGNVKEEIKNAVLHCITDTDINNRLTTDGFLSIQSSMINDDSITAPMLLKFIKKWKKHGLFQNIRYDQELKDLRHFSKYYGTMFKKKVIYIEKILNECQYYKNANLRIDLQNVFGQFDGAQFCQHCGDIMWEGYSWDGTTYCDLPCVLKGECIDENEANEILEDACDPDSECYWTSWF